MDKTATHILQIKVLPEHLINQIAAGEVVERPASVVKELLDNSLDARATQVTIDIEQGGSGLIRIKDDGVGIPHDELALALTRHATSKITQIDDLRKLRTMGFRGEALPSIASISRLSITSKSHGAEHAWTLKSEGRTEKFAPELASHPQGTSIEVRDLFFNVPARRKYLKAERTEFYQIQQLARHFAISHPELGVRLTHNGRQILNLKPVKADITERVHKINGARFMQHAVEIDAENQGLVLKGWAGLGLAARTMNDSQFFCLNGRCIKDKLINHAIQQAYQGMLPEGRYATYALYLEIDPALVDVNVHPAKTEVRFRDGRTVHDFIYSSLNRMLRESQMELSELVPPIKFNNATVVQQRPVAKRALNQSDSTPQVEKTSARRFDSVQEAVNKYRVDVKPIKSISQVDTEIEPTKFNKIGDVLLVKQNADLVLIDTKKAMLEIVRTGLIEELEKGSIRAKALLFPHSFELDDLSSTMFKQHSDLLMELGIDIYQSESQGWQLRQLPAAYSMANKLDEFIQELNTVLGRDEQGIKTQILDLLAIYYTKNTRELDQVKLLSQLEQLDHTGFGIVQKLSEEDLLCIINGTFKSEGL